MARKKKTEKEKQTEEKIKLDKILRIASVLQNLHRNNETRKKSKSRVRKFVRELKKTRDRGVRKTLEMLIKDYTSTAEKMESFMREDAKFIKRELKEIRLNGVKDDKLQTGKRAGAKTKRRANHS